MLIVLRGKSVFRGTFACCISVCGECWGAYTAELIIELKAVLEPRYIQPRRAMMIPTHSWALTGAPNRLLTLEQLGIWLVSEVQV